MITRTFLTIVALLLTVPTCLTGQPAFAQATGKQAATKFDEFGDEEYSSIIARLDNYAIQLLNQPSVKGFIIVYRSRRDLPGLSSRLALFTKNYMVNSRGIAPERVMTVDGGVALCLTYELWIVPFSTTPIPRSDAYSDQPLSRESTYKFDEFYYSLPQDGDESGSESSGDKSNLLEGFATQLRRHPHSHGYIVAYAQYRVERRDVEEYLPDRVVKDKSYKNVYLDSSGTAKAILKVEKDYLVRGYRIDPSRIVPVNGGYRKWRQVELWIVPRGEHAPIATPNAFPKLRAKRRTRRRR